MFIYIANDVSARQANGKTRRDIHRTKGGGLTWDDDGND